MNQEVLGSREFVARAETAVRNAGRFIAEERGRFRAEDVEFKGRSDLVSYVDRRAEDMLKRELSLLTPDCGFINEESGVAGGNRPLVWIIDPLDGTTNFVHGIPFYAVSVALRYQRKTILGWIYDVPHDEMFFAAEGRGAFLNGSPIRVSDNEKPADAVVATGIPFRYFDRAENYLTLMREITTQTRGLRRLGSAALDLAYTAAGRFDGFWESFLSPWDVAAGALIVTEAGG
ncbi:MAG: inositol monophosphatase family protein, partial [Bacteroidia bacterium]|nr:inositol monophosphatase [Bacteroidia bacterium]MDW8333092.1 inositol monophosphatase family protein [Bacteroidia bacterium]